MIYNFATGKYKNIASTLCKATNLNRGDVY